MIPTDGITALLCITGHGEAHILFLFIIIANYAGKPLSFRDAYKLHLIQLYGTDFQRKESQQANLAQERFSCVYYMHTYTYLSIDQCIYISFPPPPISQDLGGYFQRKAVMDRQLDVTEVHNQRTLLKGNCLGCPGWACSNQLKGL